MPDGGCSTAAHLQFHVILYSLKYLVALRYRTYKRYDTYGFMTIGMFAMFYYIIIKLVRRIVNF